MTASASDIRALNLDEIEIVGGGYSRDTCVLTWTGIGTFMGAVLGGGVGATVGGLAGAWYGNQACPVEGSHL